MTAPQRSLRTAIGKWLGAGTDAGFRITRLGRSEESRWRCVRLDVDCPSRLFSVTFFRHDDGSWQVFPPMGKRPAIGGSPRAVQPPFIASDLVDWPRA